MDKRAGLAAGAMHGHRVFHRRLHDEPVQNRAVIAVIVKAVDQAFIHLGFFGLGAPQTMP